MASKTEICNMSLSHLAHGKEISNVDTEQSDEARSCRRYYDVALESVLREFAWPFAQKRKALSLIETFSTGEWLYSYQYPSDCVYFRRILSGVRNDTRQSRAPYELLHSDTGVILYTDEEDAVAEYTKLVSDPSYYPADFELAFSFRLAYLITPRVTKGDNFNLRKGMLDSYNIEISMAKTRALNEVQKDELPASELERSRD